MSREVSEFLVSHGVVKTHSTPYHLTANGQSEREVGTIWKTVRLTLKFLNLPEYQWELVLDSVLYSISSLLCTATKETSHGRWFSYSRKSFNGYSMSSWLTTPRPVMLRQFVRISKSDPMVEKVDLESANPSLHAFPDGRQTTVTTKDLAPTTIIPTTDQDNRTTLD